ncbi:hypothetical protein Gotur_026623 [Gossypium turneri]
MMKYSNNKICDIVIIETGETQIMSRT